MKLLQMRSHSMGRIVLLVSIWIILALCLTPRQGHAQSVEWSSPQLVNTNGAFDLGADNYPQIIEDSSGTLHAVWHSSEDLNGTAGTDSDIFYSTNDGSGWSAPVLLNTNGTADTGDDEFPQIIEDGSGTLHTVWHSDENLNGTAGIDSDIFYSTNDGSGWSPPVLLNTNGTTDSGTDLSPQIIEDCFGTLHAVWHSSEDLATGLGDGQADTDDDIFHAENSGSAWSDPQLLNTNGTTDSGSDANAQIIQDQLCVLHVAWESNEDLNSSAGLDYDIFYSANNGTAWSDPILFHLNGDTDSGDDQNPQMVVDCPNDVHVVWQSDENLNGSADTDLDIFIGQAQLDPTLLNTNGIGDSGGDFNPQIIVGSDCTLHAVWDSVEDLVTLGGTAGTDGDIFYATDGGTGWSLPELLNTNGTTDLESDVNPQIVEDGLSTLHTLWASASMHGTDLDILRAFTAVVPVAEFTADPLSGTAPLVVQFTDISTGDVTGRLWSFGDGATSTEQNPVHGYAAASTYTVSLTVGGPAGIHTETKVNFITASSEALPPIESGGGSGCFIATAAFGSVRASEVDILRQFRDEILMRHRAGRAFVAGYYKYGPRAAEFVNHHPRLRPIVRTSLKPVVLVCRIVLKYPLEVQGFTLVAGGMIALLVVGGVIRKRNKKQLGMR